MTPRAHRIAAMAVTLLCSGVVWSTLAADQVRDLDGVARDPFKPAGPFAVLLFVATDCPISNGYAPEIQRICDRVRAQGGGCMLIYEDASIAAPAVRAHRAEFKYRDQPALVDVNHALATRARATVTPEAVVLDRAGVVRYRGRIDNQYAALGQPRRVVTAHDLEDAIDAVRSGRPVRQPETEAIGCFIPKGER